MNDDHELELRKLFRTQRVPGNTLAPDFQRLWSAAAKRHRGVQRRNWILRGGMLVALAVAIFIGQRKPENRAAADTCSVPWRSALLLTDWHAPSDSLLTVSDFSFELPNSNTQ